MIKYDTEKSVMPYEKFMTHGASALTEAELLAIILRTGTKNYSALDLAQKILSIAGQEKGLNSLHHLSLEELMEKTIMAMRSCEAQIAEAMAVFGQ